LRTLLPRPGVGRTGRFAALVFALVLVLALAIAAAADAFGLLPLLAWPARFAGGAALPAGMPSGVDVPILLRRARNVGVGAPPLRTWAKVAAFGLIFSLVVATASDGFRLFLPFARVIPEVEGIIAFLSTALSGARLPPPRDDVTTAAAIAASVIVIAASGGLRIFLPLVRAAQKVQGSVAFLLMTLFSARLPTLRAGIATVSHTGATAVIVAVKISLATRIRIVLAAVVATRFTTTDAAVVAICSVDVAVIVFCSAGSRYRPVPFARRLC
jgi:hypothetical protein